MKSSPTRQFILAATVAASLSAASLMAAEVEVSSTTATMGVGTITEFTPGSRITLRSETATAPVQYVIGDSVTYVDETGAPVAAEIVRTGVPVSIQYVKEGDRMIARKVIVKKTVTTTGAPVVEERKTTTTTTTTR